MMYVPELRDEPCDACGLRGHGCFYQNHLLLPGFTGRSTALHYGHGFPCAPTLWWPGASARLGLGEEVANELGPQPSLAPD